MDATKDVRDYLKVEEDAVAIRQILSTYLPPPTNINRAGFETSGFDCLVTIIRIMYAWLLATDGSAHTNHFKHLEPENSILRYSWSFLKREGPATTKQLRAWGKQKEEAVKELLGGDLTRTSFLDLYNPEQMARTFWSHQFFWLFKDVIKLIKPGHGFYPIPWDPIDLGKKSEIEVDDSKPGLPFQDAIDNNFGLKGNGADELYSARIPTFLRIRYTPSTTSPLPFSSLKTFSIPMGKLVKTGKNYEYEQEVNRVHYFILGVVRMRRSQEECDLVRTYWCDGVYGHIQPLSGSKTYFNDEWSVEEQGYTYMLFYRPCRRPSQMTLAEVQVRLEPGSSEANEMSEMFLEKLDEIKEPQKPIDGSKAAPSVHQTNAESEAAASNRDTETAVRSDVPSESGPGRESEQTTASVLFNPPRGPHNSRGRYRGRGNNRWFNRRSRPRRPY